MREKLLIYPLISFFSFCFFTFIFHTAAAASTLEKIIPSATPEPLTSPTISVLTPTIYTAPTSTPTLIPTATPTFIPPTATPTPIPTIIVVADLETLFTKYADEYHADKELLKKIARCESGFNSQADTGLYAGMFQFASQTWINTRTLMGMDPNPDLRKNTEESIRTAAFMISRGQQNAWPSCSR